MGLGKTIQTIAFLSSLKNSTSFIVEPSSLLFNQKREFEKFAPSLKVTLVNGTKKFRIETIHNAFNYDILITTYSLLRNDINDYADINYQMMNYYIKKIEILSYITKLRQIVLETNVVLDNYYGTSGKIDALKEYK